MSVNIYQVYIFIPRGGCGRGSKSAKPLRIPPPARYSKFPPDFAGIDLFSSPGFGVGLARVSRDEPCEVALDETTEKMRNAFNVAHLEVTLFSAPILLSLCFYTCITYVVCKSTVD